MEADNGPPRPRRSSSHDAAFAQYKDRVLAEAHPDDVARLMAELDRPFWVSDAEIMAVLAADCRLAELGITGDFLRALMRASEPDG